MDARVAKRYARALFQAALASNILESVEGDLKLFKTLFGEDAKMRAYFYSPQVGREERIKMAATVFSDRVTAVSMQVIRLMLSKRREHEIPVLYDQFVEMRREHQDIKSVIVTSAFELDESQRTRLVDKITQKSGKRIEATFKVDPTLIGGVSVQYGNFLLDGSVKGSLGRIDNRLRFDVLKQAVEI